MAGSTPFVLFDLGGVLIENVGFERLDRLLPNPIGLDELKRQWLMSTSVRRFELGQIDPSAFGRGFVDEWDLACTPDAFLAEFESWPKGFYPGVPDLLATLRAQYRIGCLTNSNALHWARFGGFAGVFDVTLSSHLMGSIKPDPDCFAQAIVACGRDASEIVYFDDVPLNVDAARAAGLDAERTDGAGDVLAALQRRKLIR